MEVNGNSDTGAAGAFEASDTKQKNISEDKIQHLRNQIQSLQKELEQVRGKIERLEKKESRKDKNIKEIEDRLDKSELHTATDKVSFGVDFRTAAESLHYDDLLIMRNEDLGIFFTDLASGGLNGATLDQIRAAMAAADFPPPQKLEADNDLILSTRLRLEMKSKVSNRLTFGARLAAYKVWSDSTGVKFNTGQASDLLGDGNTSSLPRGDTIHLERAYFNYKFNLGKIPTSFSAGRRPSTDGPPLEYGNYSLEGGSKLSSIINWQFDGASLNLTLEEITGIPGADFRLCGGIGSESGWGNSYSLVNSSDVEDLSVLGFISTLYNNSITDVKLNYAHAFNLTDQFSGLTVMPFNVTRNSDGTYQFEKNSSRFISRLEPTTNIGDYDCASLLLRSKSSTFLPGTDFFVAFSWSHTNPSRVSRNPYYEILGQGLLSSNGDLQSRDGYNMYVGIRVPMPLYAKLGLEYNWGSQYWLNFTGAEDSLINSKLSVRGNVYEAYYIQPIVDDNFFLKAGGRYYDYDYTGSGNPVGKPLKISQVTAPDAMMPVVDKAWELYASLTFRY